MSRALLIVDLQNDHLDGGASPVGGADEVARVTSLILEAFRDSAEPIFHVRSAAGEIASAVEPEGSEPVISKSGSDAFEGTDLEEQVRAQGVDELIVVGIIDGTVHAASDLGFSVSVVDDAVAAPDADTSTLLAGLADHAKVVASHELI